MYPNVCLREVVSHEQQRVPGDGGHRVAQAVADVESGGVAERIGLTPEWEAAGDVA